MHDYVALFEGDNPVFLCGSKIENFELRFRRNDRFIRLEFQYSEKTGEITVKANGDKLCRPGSSAE